MRHNIDVLIIVIAFICLTIISSAVYICDALTRCIQAIVVISAVFRRRRANSLNSRAAVRPGRPFGWCFA